MYNSKTTPPADEYREMWNYFCYNTSVAHSTDIYEKNDSQKRLSLSQIFILYCNNKMLSTCDDMEFKLQDFTDLMCLVYTNTVYTVCPKCALAASTFSHNQYPHCHYRSIRTQSTRIHRHDTCPHTPHPMWCICKVLMNDADCS